MPFFDTLLWGWLPPYCSLLTRCFECSLGTWVLTHSHLRKMWLNVVDFVQSMLWGVVCKGAAQS